MNLFASLRSLATRLSHRAGTESEMEEELRSHIQHRADDLARTGLARPEAERLARIDFGGYEKFREQSHQAMGGILFETLLQDLRYALRVLRKSPALPLPRS